MQEPSPPYDDILEDETLAPLKRNHACLQCKKRKVKCDAVRPTCNPCMRSHAHALRSAQRNKSRPPPLVCTYAEGDEDESPSRENVVLDAERKRSSAAAIGGKRAAVGDKLHREKERRAVEEKETLRARIAELEARIAALTTSPPAAAPVQSNGHSHAHISPTSSGSTPERMLNNNSSSSSNSHNNANANGSMPSWTIPMNTFPVPQPHIDVSPSVQPPMVSIEAGAPGQFQSFDFSNLLMLPAKWPKNLPSPAILEHMIETFFQFEPQVHRIIHRPTLLTRVRLPPTHADFPFPGLLHAICAAAAPHTAWITTLKPEELEATTTRHIDLGLDLEQCEDFAVAQSEAAERTFRHATAVCMMCSGSFVFDMARAQMILGIVYFNKGMALRSWMITSSPIRLIKALEILNRNVRKSDKPAMLGEPQTDAEREERLATVWLAYLQEASFAANSNWAPSFELDEIHVELPTSTDEFLQKHDTSGFMKGNPQTGSDPDVLVNHPVPDPFVLVVKCSIILGKVARWIRDWQQRVIRPGDTMEGFRSPGFVKLNAEIVGFQLSLPNALKNIYKMVDSGTTGTFNADLLSIHLYPNLATVLLHEQFVDWKGPESPSHRQMQKAFEAVVGFIHLIPSQLDVSLMLNPVLAFSLFNIGKIINRFIIRANEMEQYAQAMRWRTDLMAINNLLSRYGAKHALGLHLVGYLSNYQKLYESGRLQLDCSEPCKVNTNISVQSDGPDAVESSVHAPSTSGSGTSPGMHSSLGHTPESIEAVDQQTRAGMANFLSANGGMSSVETLGCFSSQSTNLPTTAPTPSFDPSLLEFLDPAMAAQFTAAMESNPSAGIAGLNTMNNMGMADANFADLLANGIGTDGKSPRNFAWN